MNRIAKRFSGAVVVALFMLLVVVCASCADSKHRSLSFTGTVQYSELEGGFYAIKGDDGIVYDPINLASEFRVPGLRVQVEALLREDLAGIHMVGPIIEITNIRTI